MTKSALHFTIASALAALCLCAERAAAIEFYVVSQPDRNLYRVDSENLGVPTLVGPITTGTDLYEIVNLGAAGLLTFDRDGNQVITLDPADASVQATATTDDDIALTVRGFDVNSAGTLYGVFAGMELRTIDRVTGATVLVANVTGAARVEALAFGPGDVLYAMGSVGADGNSENLYTLNAVTGQLTLIGPTGFADVDTLTFAPDGFLYGANARAAVTNELLRISPLTGAGTVVGNTGVFGLNGIAVVPEPSTILLVLAGLGCCCASSIVRRGRKLLVASAKQV